MNNKSGETNLDILLRNINPVLDEEELVFCTLPAERAEKHLASCRGHYLEEEGVTLIINRTQADQLDLEYSGSYQQLTLNVHSSLEAVGFLARITEILAGAGIPTNVVSAFYHDHLLIPPHQARAAVQALRKLQAGVSDEG